MSDSRPLPSPNPLTAPYWRAAVKRELHLPRCDDCHAFHFYPRALCPHCGSARLTWQRVSGKGEVYSYTVVHRAPSKGFAAMVPYTVAVVALAEGPHLMTRLIGIQPDAVRIGLAVDVDFEAQGDAGQDGETVLPVFRVNAS